MIAIKCTYRRKRAEKNFMSQRAFLLSLKLDLFLSTLKLNRYQFFYYYIEMHSFLSSLTCFHPFQLTTHFSLK